MKNLRITMLCVISMGLYSQAWGWPPGLRSSESYHKGLYGPEYKVSSFGDSIASGYNSEFWLTRVKGGTYADHFGLNFNIEYNRTIRVKNIAWAGFTLEQIVTGIKKKHVPKIKEADLIFLEGGGNDFLDLNQKKMIDLCKPENFFPTLEKAKKDYLAMMDTVGENKQPSTKVYVLGIYYPLVYETRTRACVLRSSIAPSVHASFLIAMSRFNWFVAQEAKQRGFTYVDLFARFNCAESDRNQCALDDSKTSDAYEQKLFALDEDKILQDPRDLKWMQKDHVHPNTEGHELIAQAIRAAK